VHEHKTGQQGAFLSQYAATRHAFQKQDIARLHPQNDGIAACKPLSPVTKHPQKKTDHYIGHLPPYRTHLTIKLINMIFQNLFQKKLMKASLS